MRRARPAPPPSIPCRRQEHRDTLGWFGYELMDGEGLEDAPPCAGVAS